MADTQKYTSKVTVTELWDLELIIDHDLIRLEVPRGSNSLNSPKTSFVSAKADSQNSKVEKDNKKIFLSEDFYAMAYLGYKKDIAEEHHISDK